MEQQINRRRFLGLLPALAVSATAPEMASAAVTKGYPDKPIRVVVPFPAGSGTDESARYVAQSITCLLYTSPSPRDQRGSRMPSSA